VKRRERMKNVVLMAVVVLFAAPVHATTWTCTVWEDWKSSEHPERWGF
jgi:hypothetical protein